MGAANSEHRRYTTKNGYRSGLEDEISEDLKGRGVAFEYETLKIKWTLLENKSYTPDFILPNGIIIESKGRFIVADRKKHLKIKEQHPDKDIRFVFTNSRGKISKVSKTTYGMWCDKNGFKYSDKLIPQSWMEEG